MRPIHPLQHFPLRRHQFLRLRAPIVRSRPPRFATVDATPPGETQSLESRVGSHWFNRIGILAILIGMAWFLKFAIDNHWIGPLGRVLDRPHCRRGTHRVVRAFSRAALHRIFLLAQSRRQRHPLPVSVGRVLALPPRPCVGRVSGHDRGHGVQWLSGLGPGRGVAGALCHRGRPLHDRSLSRPAKTTKSRCSAIC